MSYLLHLETSSPLGSVCVSEDETIVASLQLDEHNSHASKLTLAIGEVLKRAKIKMSELSAVSCSIGPGSYTGLRIGLSTAKGICFAMEKPLIAVSTLQSMCEAIKGRSEYSACNFLPMLDARRNDAYIALFNNSGEEVIAPSMVTVDEQFLKRISAANHVVAFGSGAFKLRPYSAEANFSIEENVTNLADYLVPIAMQKFRQKLFENLAISEPLYINQMQKIAVQ